jgi:hypothetical protein
LRRLFSAAPHYDFVHLIAIIGQTPRVIDFHISKNRATAGMGGLFYGVGAEWHLWEANDFGVARI